MHVFPILRKFIQRIWDTKEGIKKLNLKLKMPGAFQRVIWISLAKESNIPNFFVSIKMIQFSVSSLKSLWVYRLLVVTGITWRVKPLTYHKGFHSLAPDDQLVLIYCPLCNWNSSHAELLMATLTCVVHLQFAPQNPISIFIPPWSFPQQTYLYGIRWHSSLPSAFYWV